MRDRNNDIFIQLFKEVCLKCFGQPLTEPLSETDSKVLSNKILEKTGLLIGVKSIKNYSQYVLNPAESKKENPSDATLDTFARYLLNAPETEEIKRKKYESHHPYWFKYRSSFTESKVNANISLPWKKILLAIIIVLVAAAIVFSVNKIARKAPVYFTDEFTNVSADSLAANGWFVKNKEPYYWNKRDSLKGYLSLYTLVGDNWPSTKEPFVKEIKNLLVRSLEVDCFTVEVHLANFIPQHSWQQAGIILSEDSLFGGKALRLSIGFNDFFGGYSRPPEVIVQAVAGSVDGNVTRPEEIAHTVLFSGSPTTDSLISSNLTRSALKIEKKGNDYRFLFSSGSFEGFAFQEATHREFDMHPKYIGIFAMQGAAQTLYPLPAFFDSFSLIEMTCSK